MTIQLEHLKNRLLEQEISVKFNPEVVSYLAKEGYHPLYGARPLKRLIQQKLTNMLSTSLLEGKLKPKSNIELILTDNQISMR